MSYKSATVLIAIHSVKKTSLTSNPSSIGTPVLPIEEDTIVSLSLILANKSGVGISGKTLHVIGVDGIEIPSIIVTDANGQATYDYTVTGDDNGKSLTVKYNGD